MPTINEILSSEQSKDRLCIQLYSEGIFFKAYELSAWLAYHILNRFMVKKKYIRKAGQEIVSIGFPKTALGKWAAGRRMYESETGAEIYIDDSEYDSISNKDFRKWKDNITNGSEQKTEHKAMDNGIIEQIRLFPVESKTPIECMMFVSSLKREKDQKNRRWQFTPTSPSMKNVISCC